MGNSKDLQGGQTDSRTNNYLIFEVAQRRKYVDPNTFVTSIKWNVRIVEISEGEKIWQTYSKKVVAENLPFYVESPIANKYHYLGNQGIPNRFD